MKETINVMKLVVLVMLPLLALNVHSKELICRGESVEKKDLAKSKRTLVFTYDAKTLTASYPEALLQQKATGILQANPEYYAGTLTTDSDDEFSVTLDRYSGELVAMPASETSLYMFDFRGTCEAAEPKF